MTESRNNGIEFEAEVRRIARALWDTKPGDGAAQMVDGRERDCLFESEDLVHYVEVTTSRTLEKVKRDAEKMCDYRSKSEKRNRLVKLWIITRDEPTADQRAEAVKRKIEILSLREFEKRLLNAGEYLELRQPYRFGSATDPDADGIDLTQVYYQPTAIRTKENQTISVDALARLLSAGDHGVLIGDYGMGKSLTVREVFLRLRESHLRRELDRVPVVLNLREHWGQDSPSEALVRHANALGMAKPHQLVRAFNAGRLVVLLDGFDEMGAVGNWTRRESPRMRDMRRISTALVRNFADAQRGRAGFLVAGRDTYFDDSSEMRASLGLGPGSSEFRLDGFSSEEAREYLQNLGVTSDLPAWLPNRPLLLAYLARGNLLADAIAGTAGWSVALAWDRMMDMVSEREAKANQLLDAHVIRRILEILASVARCTVTGLGPVSESDIATAFREASDIDIDDVSAPLAMRLPGLSSSRESSKAGGRVFLDDEMLDVLRAGPVARFVVHPFEDLRASRWKHGLGTTGAEVAAAQVRRVGETTALGRAVVAAREATSRWSSPVLSLDLVAVARSLAGDAAVDFGGLVVEGGSAGLLDLADGAIVRRITIRGAAIDEVRGPIEQANSVLLDGCLIEYVAGYSSHDVLPEMFSKCDVIRFDDESTNASILRTPYVSIPVRVALTMLRKLYRQRGHGRKQKALSRGMDQAAQLCSARVLAALRFEGLAFETVAQGEALWHPVHGQRRRANDIIDSGGAIDDPFLERVRAITAKA